MPELSTIIKWSLVLGLLLGAVPAVRGTVHWLKTDPAANAAPSEPANAGTLAELLEPIRARHKLPGLAAAIISGGEVQALGATGVRRAGGEERLTVHDQFHIGSCTKAMTATMLGMLVEAGTLDWSTTVGEVFEDIPMNDAWKPITLEQLLHNRAGAPAHLNAGGLWPRLWAFQGPAREARMELVKGVLAEPPSTPGEFVYSNAGFAIAGAMAERRTDTHWEDLMRRRLFEPLGMTAAGFGPPGDPESIDQPRGHHASGKPEEPGPRADNPAAIGPANSVHCSLADWGRFIAMHAATAPRPNTPPLITAATLKKLQTPADGPGDRYAMGWIVSTRPWAKGNDDGEGLILTHAGSNSLWFAVVWIAPERDLAVLVTSNQGGTAARACDEAVGVLVRHIADSPAGATRQESK
jgi:CubicO group peptidase (beta-lactamase class C family)